MPNAPSIAMRTFLCLALALFVAASAHADAIRDSLSEMTKCADVADSSERLKCFDAAVTHAKSALAAPEQEPSKKSLLEWFGFSRPKPVVTKPEEFGKPPAPPAPGQEINEITATVLEFARTVRGKSVFILENGQVWRQLDADGTDLPDPSPGTTMKVTIETGALGSYNLTVEGTNRTIKVTRLK
jgi:hypothetical protein